MKRRVFTTAGLLIVAGAICLAGCDKGPDSSGKPADKAPDEKIEFANVRCPIMTGSVIDPENVPADLIREFDGKKVAFCCAGCPAAWDRLTHDEKQEKLAAVSE